jgi:hypothetical protein
MYSSRSAATLFFTLIPEIFCGKKPMLIKSPVGKQEKISTKEGAHTGIEDSCVDSNPVQISEGKTTLNKSKK